MPRRNQREPHEPLNAAALDLSPDELPAPVQPTSIWRRHPAHQKRLDKLAARRSLHVCAMPLCTGKPMHDAEHGGLGICFACALDLVDHFQKFENREPLTERQLQRELKAMAEQRRREAEADARAIHPGWVYYVRVTDRIKIGFSEDVKRRMSDYPPHAELLAVHPGTPTLEREMHAKFAGHLAQGREWFRPDAEVMEHIASVLAEFGPPPKSMIYRFREGTSQQIKPKRGNARKVG